MMGEAAPVLLGTTATGKKISLVHKAGCSIRLIDYQDCKILPKQLEGGYSSIGAALKAVDSYLAKVKAKEIKVDGTKYTARSGK